ncbi:hypothetical protein ABG768_025324 [Culter alburnus]|uniref:Uncharacterized protein n=1 Tax=Culter alburnus TaxID=194366 RepID=A0AAW2AFZ8_CULAL
MGHLTCDVYFICKYRGSLIIQTQHQSALFSIDEKCVMRAHKQAQAEHHTDARAHAAVRLSERSAAERERGRRGGEQQPHRSSSEREAASGARAGRGNNCGTEEILHCRTAAVCRHRNFIRVKQNVIDGKRQQLPTCELRGTVSPGKDAWQRTDRPCEAGNPLCHMSESCHKNCKPGETQRVCVDEASSERHVGWHLHSVEPVCSCQCVEERACLYVESRGSVLPVSVCSLGYSKCKSLHVCTQSPGSWHAQNRSLAFENMLLAENSTAPAWPLLN